MSFIDHTYKRRDNMKNEKYRNTIKGTMTKTASSLAALALGLTISSGSQATHKQYQHHDIIKINSTELGELPWDRDTLFYVRKIRPHR